MSSVTRGEPLRHWLKYTPHEILQLCTVTSWKLILERVLLREFVLFLDNDTPPQWIIGRSLCETNARASCKSNWFSKLNNKALWLHRNNTLLLVLDCRWRESVRWSFTFSHYVLLLYFCSLQRQQCHMSSVCLILEHSSLHFDCRFSRLRWLISQRHNHRFSCYRQEQNRRRRRRRRRNPSHSR